MKMRFNGLTVVAALAVALLLANAPSAYATAELSLTSGASTVLISDNGVGDFDPAPGSITFIGSIGNFTTNVSTGFTKPVLNVGNLDLNTTDNNNGGGDLVIQFSDLGFTLPGNLHGVMTAGGTIAAPIGSSVTFSAYFDNSNILFGQGIKVGDIGPFISVGPGSMPFSGQLVGPGPTQNPFSMTEVLTFHFTQGKGQTSGDYSFDMVVPEPASVTLLGGVLVLVFSTLRRKLGRA